MNARWIVTMSCLSGLGLGCGEILGLDDNKPVFDCGRCQSGYRCDERKLRCVRSEAGAAGTGTGGTTATTVESGGVATGGGSSSGGTESVGGSAGTTIAGTAGYVTGGSGGVTTGGGGIAGGGTGGIAGGVAGAGGTTPPRCLTLIPDPPPTPCRGANYDFDFTVRGGDSSYTWTVLSKPPGLELDNGHLHGIPDGPGTLAMRVEDTKSQCSIEKSYYLEPRDKCWLAYISSEGGRPQLHLFDPVLHHPTSNQYTSRMDPTKFVYPSSSSTETDSVKDFKFSPDGRYIAYRLGENPARLRLLSAPAWTEQQLVFSEGSVFTYAWSPDSKILAVALGTDASITKSLTGVRVGSEPPSHLKSIVVRLQSDLLWITGRDVVAFHAAIQEGDTRHVTHVAQLGADGFLSDVPLGKFTYSASVKLRAASSAFWAIDPPNTLTAWLMPDDPNTIITNRGPLGITHDYGYLSPSGRHSARKVSADGIEKLQIYDAKPGLAPVPETSDCPSFLGWSKESDGKELLACVGNATDTTPDTIRIFELPSTASLLSIPVKGSYDYTPDTAYQRRRAFSANGNWFAFTGASHLYVASLTGGTPVLAAGEPSSITGDTDSARLAFSPDEKWMVGQRGQKLLLHGLNRTVPFEPFQVNVDPSPPAPRCTESFWEAPESWCGTTDSPKELVWSSDSQWLAFLVNPVGTADSILQLLRVPPLFDRFSTHSACGANCVTQYEFQP